MPVTYTKPSKLKFDIYQSEIDFDETFFTAYQILFDSFPSDAYRLLTNLYITLFKSHKPVHIQTFTAKYANLNTKTISNNKNLSNISNIKQVIGILESLADINLFDVIINENSIIILAQLRVSPYAKSCIDNIGYLPPLLDTPTNWSNNLNGGYPGITQHLILQNYAEYDYSGINYKAINKLQSVELNINNYILYKYIHTEKINFNLNTYINYADQSFYFMWQYDFRGRAYSYGYDINFQSTEFKKALINLNNPVLITI